MTRIHFTASDSPAAQEALAAFKQRYGQTPADNADVIVALGGDGFMLSALHDALHLGKPVYGMNRGTVGFLLNDFAEDNLPERLAAAESYRIHPLRMTAHAANGLVTEALAINEVSLLRMSHQAAWLRITVDGRERLQRLICDGAIVATPAGSTAYNLSAHGPILPMEAELMALTPVAAFRPRRWRGAILPQSATVRFEALEPQKRPVLAVADTTEMRRVTQVDVAFDLGVSLTLLFDPGHGLSERMLREQFLA